MVTFYNGVNGICLITPLFVDETEQCCTFSRFKFSEQYCYYDFEKAGILVILPDKKHEGQIVFSGKSQEGGRDTAGGRILIENLNEQLKLYDMFGAVKYISRLDMVEHEMNMVRFLVNLKPAVNNWTANTAQTF